MGPAYSFYAEGIVIAEILLCVYLIAHIARTREEISQGGSDQGVDTGRPLTYLLCPTIQILDRGIRVLLISAPI